MEAYSEANGNLNFAVCTPSVFASTNLMHIHKIGQQQLQKYQNGKFDNCSYYSFFTITYGSCVLEYDEKQYDLSPGSCGLLDCRKMCTYSALDDGVIMIFIYFYGPNMTAIYDKYLEEGGLVCFRTEKTEEYAEIFTQISGMISAQSTVNDMLICEKLTSLLAHLMDDGRGTETRACRVSQKQDMQKVKDYLDQNYREKITLDGLARMFFINKYYLTRLFKERFGVSINNYLIQVRISHARQLLLFTDMSIEKIGQSCGINDANYFSRIFKKVEGMSPGEYRCAKKNDTYSEEI